MADSVNKSQKRQDVLLLCIQSEQHVGFIEIAITYMNYFKYSYIGKRTQLGGIYVYD